MWEFLNQIFQSGGFFALIAVVEAGVIAYLFRSNQKKQDQLLELYEKRVKDVTESKEDYEELAQKLDKSIDLLIKVFKRNGNGG